MLINYASDCFLYIKFCYVFTNILCLTIWFTFIKLQYILLCIWTFYEVLKYLTFGCLMEFYKHFEVKPDTLNLHMGFPLKSLKYFLIFLPIVCTYTHILFPFYCSLWSSSMQTRTSIGQNKKASTNCDRI